ncbi:hypothetical protein Taro_004262, partial [Colocasia esculenta]|nr:hypothetical protein [Colocasia esculenta]
EVGDLKEKLDKCEADLEKARKANELSLLPLSSFQSVATTEKWIGEGNDDNEDGHMIVPRIPAGVSGTALAASLLRDGWSLAKMFEKYQEVADALRHERWERKHSEAILERVLHEIEEKAELILDERAQHEKMVEAYSLMSQKLQEALSVHDTYENTIRTLKENFHLELQKVTDEAAAKVEAVLRRSEEQGRMLESLHTSVAMYKRLYDEERRSRSLIPHSAEPILGIAMRSCH